MKKNSLIFSKTQKFISIVIGNFFILILFYLAMFKPIFISMQQSSSVKVNVPNLDNTAILLMYLNYLLIPIALFSIGTLLGFVVTTIIKTIFIFKNKESEKG